MPELGLICLPGLSSAGALAAGAAYARSRRVLYVAEAASSKTATLTAVKGIPAPDRGHVTVYFPRVEVPDPLHPHATIPFGPSAAIAGLLIRTDRERGYWGFPIYYLQGVVGLGATIDAHGAALLRRSGVNALRLTNSHGFLPWGARTVGSGRQSDEDWEYVPVRRLAGLGRRVRDAACKRDGRTLRRPVGRTDAPVGRASCHEPLHVRSGVRREVAVAPAFGGAEAGVVEGELVRRGRSA